MHEGQEAHGAHGAQEDQMAQDSASWLPLAAGITGALMIAMSAPLVRLSGVEPSTSAAFRCLYALPFLAVLAARERRRFGPRPRSSRRAAMLAGAFFVADLTLWHHAIELVGAGLATVLANAQVVIVGLVAWAFLGERPVSRTLAGVPVVLIGVALIAGITGGGYGEAPALGAVLGFLTAVAYSGFILLLRRGNTDRRRPAGPLLDATLVAAVGTVVVGALVGGVDLVPSWPAHGWLFGLALNSQVVAWMLISVSLPRLPALATSTLLLLQPVGAVAIGVAFLDEAPSVVQLAGVVLVLLGVALAGSRKGRRAKTEPAALSSA
jgi:drug/metabolite transporter (DMT)-like permease